MKKTTEDIVTRRLRLRLATDEETAALADAAQDEHMTGAYGEMLAGAKSHPDQRMWYAPWLICLKNGTQVGDLCFKGVPEGGAVEIGYGVEEAYRGRGYAPEAVKALCRRAFAQPDVYVIEAQAEEDNAASLRVLGKAGFLSDGQGPEGERFALRKPDSLVLALYMCFGMTLGIALGGALGNQAVGTVIGMGAGLALGTHLDAQDKRKRQAAESARRERHDKGM